MIIKYQIDPVSKRALRDSKTLKSRVRNVVEMPIKRASRKYTALISYMQATNQQS